MLSQKDNMLQFNQYMKLDKMPYIIYTHLESLIKKIDWYANNQEKSPTTNIGEHIPCGYSMSALWAFESIEHKHTLYRGEDTVKKFCTSLKVH